MTRALSTRWPACWLACLLVGLSAALSSLPILGTSNLSLESSHETRIHLGVWDQGEQQSFLGGLSFPLHTVVEAGTRTQLAPRLLDAAMLTTTCMHAGHRFEGWYLLLSQEEARTKHVAVSV